MVSLGRQQCVKQAMDEYRGEGPPGLSTFDVATYLSADKTLDAPNVLLDQGGYSVSQYHLNVGWSSVLATQVLIPAFVLTGSYHIIVVADALPGQPPNFYPGVVEADESNNWQASGNIRTHGALGFQNSLGVGQIAPLAVVTVLHLDARTGQGA
jgi:hypothetical protein